MRSALALTVLVAVFTIGCAGPTRITYPNVTPDKPENVGALRNALVAETPTGASAPLDPAVDEVKNRPLYIADERINFDHDDD